MDLLADLASTATVNDEDDDGNEEKIEATSKSAESEPL
jgi:hypothetical protein